MYDVMPRGVRRHTTWCVTSCHVACDVISLANRSFSGFLARTGISYFKAARFNSANSSWSNNTDTFLYSKFVYLLSQVFRDTFSDYRDNFDLVRVAERRRGCKSLRIRRMILLFEFLSSWKVHKYEK